MKLYGACLATYNVEAMVKFYEKVFGYKPYIDGPDHRFLDAQLIIYNLMGLSKWYKFKHRRQTTAI